VASQRIGRPAGQRRGRRGARLAVILLVIFLVAGAISLLFGTFTATGSAFAVVRAFRQAQLTFPARHRGGPRTGELYFKTLAHDQVLKILHNPCYAGAYCYGRARHTTDLDGYHHTLIKPAGVARH